jgi:MYXO-CTERM domain-containing protein
MNSKMIRNAALAAVALAMSPVAAQAQVTNGAGTAYERDDDDDDGTDWGWLGLLGLAGLLGLKKKDAAVHVDARHKG